MPKLTKKIAGDVDKAEQSEGFALAPDGLYLCRLREVAVSDKEGPSGYFYWNWVFEIPEDAEEFAKKRFFNTTSLSPEAFGMPGGMKATFAAFGVSPDTDTDDLCGEFVTLYIGHEIQQKGKNQGKPQNVVLDIFPADYDPEKEDETFE